MKAKGILFTILSALLFGICPVLSTQSYQLGSNAMTLTLLDEGPERLLGMPEKEFFLLITQAALDNMDNIAGEYRDNFAKGVPGDE